MGVRVAVSIGGDFVIDVLFAWRLILLVLVFSETTCIISVPALGSTAGELLASDNQPQKLQSHHQHVRARVTTKRG
ncbi:hypothetical protein J3F84DRAFT_383716 [Trichoderma pleuroticola]